MGLTEDIVSLAAKVKAGFVWIFHAIEHEIPMVLTTLVNVYGPDVVSHAIATYKGNVETFAGSEAAVAEADLNALVQSSIVQKFGLPPTAAQFIASGIHHLFTIGEDKMNSLIEQGATAAIADVTGSPAAPPPATS